MKAIFLIKGILGFFTSRLYVLAEDKVSLVSPSLSIFGLLTRRSMNRSINAQGRDVLFQLHVKLRAVSDNCEILPRRIKRKSQGNGRNPVCVHSITSDYIRGECTSYDPMKLQC